MDPDIPTIPLDFKRLAIDEMRRRSEALRESLKHRRTVRHFYSEPVPVDVVRNAIRSAAQAPSGANKQPWTFVMVRDPAVKRQIRELAEKEERDFYARRASDQWLSDLQPFGTNANKPFLEQAPLLIVAFAHARGPSGEKHYYVKESIGIACGVLLASLHWAGLATLTYTPSPMEFLGGVLERPAHERPFLVFPVGYPAAGCQVPAIERKPLSEVFVEVAPWAALGDGDEQSG